jgi:hypothetical protein
LLDGAVVGAKLLGLLIALSSDHGLHGHRSVNRGAVLARTPERHRAYGIASRLRFIGRRIGFRRRRWRGGFGPGWGTLKLWRARTVSGPNFGTLDRSNQLAARWRRRLCLFHRLATLGRRGLSQGISREADDSEHKQDPHGCFCLSSAGVRPGGGGLRGETFLRLHGLCTPMFRQFAVSLTCPCSVWAE